MIKNYLKTALRNLTRHKVNSLVNISGLAVGFAAFLLIFLVIQYEQSFDTFHTKKDQLYRVVRAGKNPTDRSYRTGVPVPVTQTLRAEYPQLANVGSIASGRNVQVVVTANDGSPVKKFKEASGVFFAEPQFFQMFDFPLVAGNNALNEPNTVLLTKDIASKYFGDWQAAMGQTINMNGLSIHVTGILDHIPSNTDFPIKAVISYPTFRNYMSFESWSSISDQNYCFVQLPAGQSPADFQPLLDRFVDTHIKPVDKGYDLILQSLSTVHHDGRLGNFNNRTFSEDLILALTLIGLFLLIVACVNFINLTTVQAVARAREVGVRKVLGSGRGRLIVQFLGETGITCLLALLVAVVIAVVCIPLVNGLLGIHVSAAVLYSGRLLMILLGTWLAVTVLSGFYPAMVLSGFNPIAVLKGSAGNQHPGGVSFRRALVVFQFVIAQGLIIATLVVASQMDYFRAANMGFNQTAIINANFPNDSAGFAQLDALHHDLLTIPGVEKVSFSSATPATGNGSATDLWTPENQSGQFDMIVGVKRADTGFFGLYQLPFVAGRAYRPADTATGYVVNETTVRKLGIQHAQDAIGKMIRIDGSTLPIVGVVKDFHANSLRDPIDPLVLYATRRDYRMVSMTVNLRDANAVIAKVGSAWDKHFPNFTFEYSFLDQDIAAFYQQENQLSILYKIFSGIAIFISCLGLYGLISFMAVQRRKEIGIRKVLGAPVKDIVVMLSKEFSLLIVIAFLIATPIAWYFMHAWLQQYTYRIMIGVWFFAATIVGSLCIAWLTVGYTAIKAALANPVQSLRTE